MFESEAEVESDPAAELLACAQDQVRAVATAQQRQAAVLAELWTLRVQQDLAADADLFSADVDPATGALTDHHPFGTAPGADLTERPSRHSPGAALARLVRLRDGGCWFPGCGVPARRCDFDHLVPFDHEQPERGGHSVRDNLFCLCRYHHRAKTLGVWSYEHVGGGILAWTSPTGGAYETSAHVYGGTVDSRTPTCHGGS